MTNLWLVIWVLHRKLQLHGKTCNTWRFPIQTTINQFSDHGRRKSSCPRTVESWLNQDLLSEATHQQTRESTDNPTLTPHLLQTSWIPCLHSCCFLNLSPLVQNHFLLSHYKRITLQKPPGTTASARQWKTSNRPPGWPWSDRPTGHPLSRLDRTSWCWQRNMRTSSLEAQSLFSPQSNKGLRFPKKH